MEVTHKKTMYMVQNILKTEGVQHCSYVETVMMIRGLQELFDGIFDHFRLNTLNPINPISRRGGGQNAPCPISWKTHPKGVWLLFHLSCVCFREKKNWHHRYLKKQLRFYQRKVSIFSTNFWKKAKMIKINFPSFLTKTITPMVLWTFSW